MDWQVVAAISAAAGLALSQLWRWIEGRSVRWIVFDVLTMGSDHKAGTRVYTLANVGDGDAFEVRAEGARCTALLLHQSPRAFERSREELHTVPLLARVESGGVVGLLVTPEGDDIGEGEVTITWIASPMRLRRSAQRASRVLPQPAHSHTRRRA